MSLRDAALELLNAAEAIGAKSHMKAWQRLRDASFALRTALASEEDAGARACGVCGGPLNCEGSCQARPIGHAPAAPSTTGTERCQCGDDSCDGEPNAPSTVAAPAPEERCAGCGHHKEARVHSMSCFRPRAPEERP